MKKIPLALLLLTAATLSHAQSWQFLPVLNDPGHRLAPTLAITAGAVDADGAPDAGTWGAELNFNCGLIQSPDNRIRSYLQINRTEEEDGVRATIVELSPRYMVPLGESFAIGAGPSVTAVRVKAPGVSRTVYGAGLAAGLDWRAGRLYAGLDVRWHDTDTRRGVKYDSTAVGLKVGVNF
ncbi:MAG TPA: hypothetical protein VFZ93_02195 [Albitalea sp.]